MSKLVEYVLDKVHSYQVPDLGVTFVDREHEVENILQVITRFERSAIHVLVVTGP